MTSSLTTTALSAIKDPASRQRIVTFANSVKYAQAANAATQKQYAIGSPEWNFFEALDDLYHDTLLWLGE